MLTPSDLPRLAPLQLIASPAPAPGALLLPALRLEAPDALRLPALSTHGSATLLCVPTENAHKVALLRAHEQAHTRGVLHVLAQKQPSNVPDQPYDAQGPQGAVNRTRHTLAWLASPAGEAYLARHAIGHVVVAAIENFIACEGTVTPGDYACVLRTDVTAGTCQLGLSAGVAVPRDCLARAQQVGSHLTVGKVIAQLCPGVRADDWHAALAGVSRYDLVREVLSAMAAR